MSRRSQNLHRLLRLVAASSFILLSTGCFQSKTENSVSSVASQEIVVTETTKKVDSNPTPGSTSGGTANSQSSEEAGLKKQEPTQIPVYLSAGVERVWQNGPSPEALKQDHYGRVEVPVSGKPNAQGNNTPVLLEIPTKPAANTPFNHGLDP